MVFLDSVLLDGIGNEDVHMAVCNIGIVVVGTVEVSNQVVEIINRNLDRIIENKIGCY